MIVNDDDVELERYSLRQRAINRVFDSPLAVTNRDHYACSNWKVLLATRRGPKLGREIGANPFQMLGCDLLHLDLILTLTGINVIKLPLAARSALRRDARVKGFRDS